MSDYHERQATERRLRGAVDRVERDSHLKGVRYGAYKGSDTVRQEADLYRQKLIDAGRNLEQQSNREEVKERQSARARLR
jgi:hypothetical protein